MTPRSNTRAALLAFGCGCLALSPLARSAPTGEATISVSTDTGAKRISPDLFGIFFEDINYAADGGLYAELIQNRSFEYSAGDRKGWNALTSWEPVGNAELSVETSGPLNPNNPHYAVLDANGGGGGLRNGGFDGIALKAGDTYDFSVFARSLKGTPSPVDVRLESKDGGLLARATLPAPGGAWRKSTAELKPDKDATDAQLVVAVQGAGSTAFDMVSLFPRKTFKNRPNGLRPDLAQAIAGLKPRFMRFPGGCLAHGDGLDNMYRWQDTVGPVEARKAQRNIWRYHQTTGLGYFEYFQFCEDIGAKPLPVVPAGVCCQNSGNHIPGAKRGQQGIPMNEMDSYIQEVLDLVEWANGPATSKWGAVRAAAGHPEPFHLQYLGVGNEDEITPVFEERFAMIQKAVQTKYPGIVVIGTVGPAPNGPDFERGWKFARANHVPVVDEHYYMQPGWFLANLHRYDSYDRKGPKVYLGEYASRGNTLFNALAEAAYLTSLERNGDVVWLSSYAPLLAKSGHTQWNPDMIYFDNTAVMLTPNYHAQHLFSNNAGDVWLPNTVKTAAEPAIADSAAGIFLGTWDTQAEFDDVRVQSGGTTLLNESFSRNPDGWTVESGDWNADGGVYRQVSNPAPALARAGVRIPVRNGTPNYTVSLRARKTGGSEGFLVGFGATGPGDCYWWNIGGWGNRAHGIEQQVAGVKSAVGGQADGHIETGKWHDIKITVEGSRIRCYLDGRLVHDVTAGQDVQEHLAVSSVLDTHSGDVILKLVNVQPGEVQANFVLQGRRRFQPVATCTVLGGNPGATNSLADPRRVAPTVSQIPAGPTFQYRAPANSLTVIRLKKP